MMKKESNLERVRRLRQESDPVLGPLNEPEDSDWVSVNEASLISKVIVTELKDNPVESIVDFEDQGDDESVELGLAEPRLVLDKFVKRDGLAFLEIDRKLRLKNEQLQGMFEQSLDQYCEYVMQEGTQINNSVEPANSILNPYYFRWILRDGKK